MTPEQTALFEEKREKLEENRLAIFDDVIEEYIDCRMLLNRFNQFRDSYHKYYKVCFIEECAGSVLIPVIKGSYMTKECIKTFRQFNSAIGTQSRRLNLWRI